MKALILAAGLGNRLGLSKDAPPKALVRVAGKELIAYQLELLKDSPIQKIGVVTGFQANRVADFIGTVDPNIALFENTQYKEGNILSLQAALPFLDDAFLLMNVDHIYPPSLLARVLEQAKGVTAACDFDRQLFDDDMKVLCDTEKNLKAIDKKLETYNAGYIGMTFCPKAKLPVYLAALKKTVRTFGTKTSVEKILATLADDGEPIGIADTSGKRWLEIDTMEELQKAEKVLNEKKGL